MTDCVTPILKNSVQKPNKADNTKKSTSGAMP